MRVRLLIGTASLVPAQPQRYQFGTSSPLLDARACARTRTREEIAKHLKSSAITAGGPPDPQLSLNCLESDMFFLPAQLHSESKLKNLPQVPFPSLRSSLEGGCSPHSCPPAFRRGLHSSNRSEGCSAAVQ